MNRARWYSSSTALVNGEIYIQGGNGGGDRPEVRHSTAPSACCRRRHVGATPPRSRAISWRRTGGCSASTPTAAMYYVNPAGTGQIATAGQFSSPYAGWTSSAAMFRPGKILQIGGNSNGAVVIDITGAAAGRHGDAVDVVAAAMGDRDGARRRPRARHGRQRGRQPADRRQQLRRDLESRRPDSGRSAPAVCAPGCTTPARCCCRMPACSWPAAARRARCRTCTPRSTTRRISTTRRAAFATRPTIVTAPDSLEIGQDFTIGVGSADIQRVTLVKTGSVTHSVNMDQRFLELPFTASSGTLFVEMTDNVTVAPPGYYLMFVINQNGVPSLGKIVRMNIPANPVIELDYTPIIGGAGGTPFQLSCNANETLVGVLRQLRRHPRQPRRAAVRARRPGRALDRRPGQSRRDRAARPARRSRRPARATTP